MLKHALAALLVAGCASMHDSRCAQGAEPVIQDTLYFGTAMPGGTISDRDFQTFVQETVTPRFSDGLTTWQASGQWRGSDGKLVQEPSHVLLVVHPRDAKTGDGIAEIVQAFKSRFHQEAVLRVQSEACASF